MSESDIKVSVVGDSSSIDQTFAKIESGAGKMAQAVSKSGADAGKGLDAIGEGAEKSAEGFNRAEGRMAASIKRMTLDLQTLGKTASEKIVAKIEVNDKVDAAKMQPFIDKLREAERVAAQAKTAQEQLAEAVLAQADARKVAEKAIADEQRAQASAIAQQQQFLKGLNDQASAIGKTASEMAEMRAQQLGVSKEAAPMIARLREAEQGANGMGAAFSKAAGYIKLAVAGMAGFSVAGLVKESTMLAARFETMGIVMNVAGNNAGYTRTEMAELEKQMQKTGISMIGSREVLTSLATANINLADSTKLARAAQDLAVVGNINSTEALSRMVNGIKSGEVEVLKTLGLNVSFEASYKKMAATLGITTDALTEQQKVMARTNIVLDESIRYSGIYEESMTAAGKAMGSMSRLWEDFKVRAGDSFLPTLAAAVFNLTDGLKLANAELAKAGSIETIDSIGGGLAGAFKTVFETVVVLGANVIYVFTAIKKEIEGIIKQAAALATLDFDGAAKIRAEMVIDAEAARKAIDAFSDRVMGVGAQVAVVKVAPTVSEADRMAAGEASRKLTEQEAARAAWSKITEQNMSKQAKLAQEIAAIEAAGLAAGISRKDIEIQIAAAKAKSAGAGNGAADASAIAALKARLIEEKALATELSARGTQTVKLNQYERQAAQIAEQLNGSLKGRSRAALEATKALAEQVGAQVRANKATSDFIESREKYLQSQREGITRIAEEAQAMEDQVAMYGLGKSAIEEMDIARLNEQATILAGISGSEEQIELIKQEIAERERLKSALVGKEALDEQKKYAEELKRTHERVGDHLTEALMRGFESGKSFAENFRDTLKNMFKTLILQPMIQPVMAGIAGGFMGGAANAGQLAGSAGSSAGGSLGGITSLFSNFGGSVAGSVSNIGSWMAQSGAQGVSDMGANLIMNADKIGEFADIAGDVVGYGMSVFSAFKGEYGKAAGQAIGTYFGGPIGSFIGGTIGGFVDKAFAGETRHGGSYNWTAERGSVERGKWDSGDPGAEANKTISDILDGAVATINSAFKGVGSQAGLSYFMGWAESSEKGRGGTASGGRLDIDGYEVGFGTTRKGQGHGSTSGDLGEMISNMTVDVYQTVIQAWQAGIAEFPQLIQDMIRGIDADSLSAEAAQAVVAQVSETIAAVNAMTAAFDTLPFENLRDLSFDATAALLRFGGGVEAFSANLSTYYDAFYSEEEKLAAASQNMAAALSGIGVAMPDVSAGAEQAKAAYRAIVESLDLTTESGQQAYATMIGLSGGFAELVAGMDQLAIATGAANEAVRSAADIQRERLSLEMELLQLQGNTEEIRRRELDALDESNRGLQEHIWAMGDQAEAAQKAADHLAAIASERLGLEGQLLQLQGNTAELRRRELAALDETNRGLQERIWALQKEAEVAAERLGLENQILQLEGNTAEIRKRQLAALDESNRALQENIWALNDQAEAAKQAAQAEAEAKRAAYANLQGAVNREKTYWSDIASAAQAAISSLTSTLSLLTDNAQALYGAVDSAQQWQAAKGMVYIEDALSSVRRGSSVSNFDGLSNAISAARDGISNGVYASQFEQDRDALVLAGQLAELGALTDSQLSTQERSLKAAQTQITQIDQTLKYWQELLDGTSSQIDATLGVGQAVEALRAVMGDVAASLTKTAAPISHGTGTAGSSPSYVAGLDNTTGTIYSKSQLYSQMVTGSATDADVRERFASWGLSDSEWNTLASVAAQEQANEERRQAEYAEEMRKHWEALGVPGYAAGGQHSGGLRIVGERGWELEATGPSRIWNQEQISKALTGGGNEALIAEIRALRSEVSALRAANERTAGNTESLPQMVEQFDRVTAGGNAMATEEMV